MNNYKENVEEFDDEFDGEEIESYDDDDDENLNRKNKKLEVEKTLNLQDKVKDLDNYINKQKRVVESVNKLPLELNSDGQGTKKNNRVENIAANIEKHIAGSGSENSGGVGSKRNETPAINYADTDFRTLYETAMSLFSQQATQALKNNNEVDLKDIELTKAKANSFLDAINNVMAVKHELDVASAEKHKFKRKDELELLNNLRIVSTIQSEVCVKNAEYIRKKVYSVYDNAEARGEEVDVQELGTLNNILESNIDSSNKITAQSARLIQLERFSGSRPWGSRTYAGGSGNNIQLINTLDARKHDKERNVIDAQRLDSARQLTYDEIKKLTSGD